jgi:hypothetical protein
MVVDDPATLSAVPKTLEDVREKVPLVWTVTERDQFDSWVVAALVVTVTLAPAPGFAGTMPLELVNPTNDVPGSTVVAHEIIAV